MRPTSTFFIIQLSNSRRKALMRQFQSLEAIREADVEALAAVPSMNRAAAEKVWKFFH